MINIRIPNRMTFVRLMFATGAWRDDEPVLSIEDVPLTLRAFVVGLTAMVLSSLMASSFFILVAGLIEPTIGPAAWLIVVPGLLLGLWVWSKEPVFPLAPALELLGKQAKYSQALWTPIIIPASFLVDKSRAREYARCEDNIRTICAINHFDDLGLQLSLSRAHEILEGPFCFVWVDGSGTTAIKRQMALRAIEKERRRSETYGAIQNGFPPFGSIVAEEFRDAIQRRWNARCLARQAQSAKGATRARRL